MDRFEVFIAALPLTLFAYLHSSMDRFEDGGAYRRTCTELDLHSSMDRFEVLLIPYFLSPYFIYIPVWIDLKIGGIADAIGSILFTFQYG